jgi:hypothetical protein
MSSAISYLNLIAGDKSTLQSFIEALHKEVGATADPLKLHAQLTHLIKGLESVKKLNEMEVKALPDFEKDYTAWGFKFNQVERGVSYDYSTCNHPEWVRLKNKEIDLVEKRKAIEETLKTIREPMTIIEEDTGECYELMPPIRKSTTTIEVK